MGMSELRSKGEPSSRNIHVKAFVHFNKKVELLYYALGRTPQTVTELKYRVNRSLKNMFPDVVGMRSANEQSIKRWLDDLIRRGIVVKASIMKGKRKINTYAKTEKEMKKHAL